MEWVRSIALTGAFLLMLSFTGEAWSAIQSPQSIRAAAEAFLHAEMNAETRDFAIDVGAVDRRLRLTQCEQPLEVFRPQGRRLSGRTTVGVRCHGPRRWKLFVNAEVSIFGQVAVSTRPIRRGETISADAISLQRKRIDRLSSDAFEATTTLAGRRAKRSIRVGSVITPSMLHRTFDVRRGARVTLVSGGPGIQITMLGNAMTNASIGDAVRVKNARSGRIVEGVVTDKRTVRIAQ